jgi:hypothetical protein
VLDNVGIDLNTAVDEEAFENFAPGRGIADASASFDFPEISGSSVSQRLNSSATMAADRC